MTEYNVQQKQFIQEYKASHHLENKSDEQILLFIQKDMQTNGVVYPGFENLVKPQNKPAYTGQIFGNSTTSNDMAGIAIEHGGTTTATKESEKEIITDENGNEVAVVKNGDEIVEATLSQTDSNGNKLETVVSYENGKPVKQIKKQNGNVSSVTKFTYNEPTENMPFQSVTVETIDGGKNKIITTALETDEYGNVDQEDFISRKTISKDGTETTVIIGSECIKEEKLKFDGKKVATLYNGTDLADFDNHKLHRIAQETEIDGVKRYAEYDGKGNTKTTVQNGESPALIAQKFNVKEQALMRLNPQKGKNAITQVGADILIPGEFNADSYPMRVRKSKAESLNKYSQFEARRLAKEINSGEVQNIKLAKSYNNVYEFAKYKLLKSGVKNPDNNQINEEANKLILLNGEKFSYKAGKTVKIAKSLTNSKQASELTKYGFQASAENRIFFKKFNALNPQQKQNVLSAIQYCKSQKITNPSDIKAKVLETLGINLFDSDKTVPVVADNNWGVMAYQRNSKPISIETFVKDHLKLNIKSEPGKTVLERLSQVEQTKLNKISAKDFKGFNNKTLDSVASMLETVGVQIRTQAEINVKNNTPRAKAEKEKRAVRTAAAENIALAYDNAINVIKNYQGNQGWMNVAFYREKLGQLLDKVNPTDVATCFDAVVKRLEKEKQFAVSRLKTASANESEFKQAFKNLTGKDYNENAVKNFLAQAQKGGDWSKSYDQAFGDKVVKRATDKVNFQQYVDGAGDIVLMLLGTEAIGKGVAWAGGKVATKLSPYVPKVLSKLGAKGIMTIGNSTVTVGKVVGNMATSAATFTAWDATKNYINLKIKDIQYTGEDAVKEWQAYKEGNVESGKFGAFAGLLNSTVVGKVVNGTMKIFEKPVAKAMQGVATTLEKGEATGADVMKTFMAKQTPGMLAKTAGIVAEVSGFTMYETANNLTKKLLQTDANGQLHLPKDLTEEGLTQYLLKNIPEEFLKQAKGIGEIKAISKLIFMHKGAVAERERMMNENLSKCEMLGKVKIQKAEVEGAEVYAITTPNGNRKIARSQEDVVAYCNVLMQMDMAMNSKTTATETNPNETKVKTPKGLVEKTQTTSPVENVKNKVISEVAKDIKDEGMRLNTPESLDAELAEAEQNPNAPVDNLEALNLVINGKIGNVLKAQYDNASNVFKDIAKKYSSELDQLEKQYGNDKKLFAEKFTEFLADKLGVKGIEPKIVLRDTGDADGFFDWSTGELAVNSKLNNSKDIQTMIAHEFIHVMQFKDMIANRGAEAVSSLLMHDTKFITAKAIELAKNNGADYKSLPIEEQQIYKEACSEMLADEVMEANKGLVDFAQKNPISKGSLNEYLSRIYQNEYENMKTDVNSPEYYNQVIENEAYYLGNGQLGLNLKGSIHFADTKTSTPIKNSGVNVPKGVVQSLDAETAKAKIKEHFSNKSSDSAYKGLIECCTADSQPNEVLLNKALLLLDSGLNSYECRNIIRSLKSKNGSVDTKAINKFEELIQNGTGAKDIGVTIQDCKDKNGIFSDELYNRYTSLKSQDYGQIGVLDACMVDGEIVETTWQKALELEKFGLKNHDIESVLRACRTKSTVNGKTKVTGFSEDLYSKAKTLIVEQKFEADNAAKIVKACVDKEGKFSQQEFDRAIKYHDKFTEWELPDWIRYSDKALDFAHNLQQKYKVDDWDLTWIIDSWHTKEDGRMFLNDACMAKSEELISKYNVDPRDVSMLINASKTDTEFLFTNYNEVVKLHQAGIKSVDDIMEACTTKIDSENSTVNYDLLHKAAEWQKLGIEENYIRIYAQEINQQKFDVTKNDLVKTYHDAKFEPQNIQALIFTNKNLKGITPNEFRDKVLELKKQGYDESKIINALRQIGASYDWSNPSDKLTKENFDKVVDMFDKGIDDPVRIAYMAKENFKLNQEKFNVLYKQAVAGIPADKLYYLQYNVEKPEMKDILTDLAKTVNKESNYNDFATLANVMQSRSVDVAKASLDALKNGAKESDILELIKFNPSEGGPKFEETIRTKTLNALKEHPEKGQAIREIARILHNTLNTPEVISQKLDLYLNNIEQFKDILTVECPLDYSGDRTYRQISKTTDLMHQLNKAGVPINEVLKYTDILCMGSEAYSENFSPKIIAKIVELHNNKKMDKNVLSFIHSLGNTDRASDAVDYIVNLKDEKALDEFNEQDIRSLGHTLAHWVENSGVKEYKIYDNYKEITDFYVKNKDILKSKDTNIDLGSLIVYYEQTHQDNSLNLDVFKSLVDIAKKTGIGSQRLCGLLQNEYSDKLPAFVEKIDFEKYPNEAKLFIDQLCDNVNKYRYSELINEKMTRDDLDYIFDLQKLISEKNKNGKPTILGNNLFNMFTEGKKITPEALDKLRYYVEMKLADPKNTDGTLYLNEILSPIQAYKTIPEKINNIESLMFDKGFNQHVMEHIIENISKDTEVATKQVDLLEDIVNFASSRFEKDTYLQSSLDRIISNKADTIDIIDIKVTLWRELKSSLEAKSVVNKIKEHFNKRDELNIALMSLSEINAINGKLIKYTLNNDKYRDLVLSHASSITETNAKFLEDLIMNDKIKDAKSPNIRKIISNTAYNICCKEFVEENFEKIPIDYLGNISDVINSGNIKLANSLFFNKELDFPKECIADVLRYTNKINIDSVADLCENHKEYGIEANNVAQIIPVLKDVNLENLKLLQNYVEKESLKNLEPYDFVILTNNLEIIGKTSAESLLKSERYKLINTLLANKSRICQNKPSGIKSIAPIYPTNETEYAERMKELSDSLNISFDKLTPEKQAMFDNSINSLSSAVKEMNLADLSEINLKYSQKEFINNINELLKNLPTEEHIKLQNKFGFRIVDDKLTGYPKTVKDINSVDFESKELLNKINEKVDSFLNNNALTVKDNPQLNSLLNDLFNNCPEILNQIDGTQEFASTVKRLQTIVNCQDFKTLSDSDQKIIVLATLVENTDKSINTSKDAAFDAFFIGQKYGLSDNDAKKLYYIVEAGSSVETFMQTTKDETIRNYRGTVITGQDRQDKFDMIALNLKEDNRLKMTQMLYSSKYPEGFTRNFDKALENRVNEIKSQDFILPQTPSETYQNYATAIKISRGNNKYNVNIVNAKDIPNMYAFVHTPEAGYATGGTRAANFSNFEAFATLNDDKVICTSYVSADKAGLVSEHHNGFIFEVQNDKQYVAYGRDIYSLGKNIPDIVVEYYRDKGFKANQNKGEKYDHRTLMSNIMKQMLFGKDYYQISKDIVGKIAEVKAKYLSKLYTLKTERESIIKNTFGTDNITNEQYRELKSNTTFVNIEKQMKALRNQELAEIENIPEYKELKDMDNKYIARLDNVKVMLGNKPMTLDNIRTIDTELADAYKAFLDKDGANKVEHDNSASLLRSSWHNEALVSNPKITGIFTDNINKIPEEYLEKAQEEHLPIVIFDVSN